MSEINQAYCCLKYLQNDALPLSKREKTQLSEENSPLNSQFLAKESKCTRNFPCNFTIKKLEIIGKLYFLLKDQKQKNKVLKSYNFTKKFLSAAAVKRGKNMIKGHKRP